MAFMVETQVQIPDRLYEEAQRVAAENEMSFAEVVRRGLEELILHHPPNRKNSHDWSPPMPYDMGEPLVEESKWTEICHEDGEF